jgi:lipoprotein-anchoring transpeptidase ErfK/SrfK
MALAAALGAAILTAADVAHAQWFGGLFGSPYPYYGARPRLAEPARPYYYKPRRKPVETTKKEQSAKPPTGPLLIAISINDQRLRLYSSGASVAQAPVSTGIPGHPTPTGIFSVIGKERFHRSNLYSNAPMPFMQRITWSGVAIHQGVLPGYPASHGCIRLPESFAVYLWGTTRLGARVIITHDPVTPFEIAHAKLFVPRPNPDEETADAAAGNRALKVAESDDPVRTSDAPKPAGLGIGESDGVPLKGSLDVPMSGAAGAAARSQPAGGSARKNAAAAELSDMVDAQAPSPTAMDSRTPGAAAESLDKRGRTAEKELKETPRMSDPVSVFISRKTARLYVRQGFEPLFESAVTIRDPDLPLGTHLYTATEFNEGRTAMRWIAVSLSDHATSEPPRHRSGKRREREALDLPAEVSASLRLAAASALDRVTIPQDAVDRISDLLSPGASLIISDYPLSGETGKYTDFIILTR